MDIDTNENRPEMIRLTEELEETYRKKNKKSKVYLLHWSAANAGVANSRLTKKQTNFTILVSFRTNSLELMNSRSNVLLLYSVSDKPAFYIY